MYEGLCDADIGTLTAVQRLIRAKRKKNRRNKMPREKPNVTVHVQDAPRRRRVVRSGSSSSSSHLVVISRIGSRM